MNDKEKIKKIKGIIKKVDKKFVSMPGGDVSKYQKKDLKTLENNFILYAKSLSDIDLVVKGEKEIWVKCPYCGLKFTKIVKDAETKKEFWCETCPKRRDKNAILCL